MTLKIRDGGSGEDVLLLLHGLGATGDIWRDIDRGWPGRWLAPDLSGHGGSDRLPVYTFDAMAGELHALLHDVTRPGDRVAVLGHSLGGAIGLALAALSDRVEQVVGLGIKVSWSTAELQRAREMAQRPVQWFDSRGPALDRHRRVAGLGELVDDAAAGSGVLEHAGRWRLALDPAVFAVGAPDMPALLARCPVPVTLARGEHDHMVTDAEVAVLVADPVTLPGLGHNAHLEDPQAVLALVRQGGATGTR
jgi:pimeloyl-ACP methyl ester carboxylesterase